MNPYYNAVVVTVRTVAILFFAYRASTGVSFMIQGVIDPFSFVLVAILPIALYFLAKPIALLATLGIK